MKIEDFRRHLHRNAELPTQEHATAAFLIEQLTALGIECRPIAMTGVLARIEGRRGNAKRCVVLCANIAAQPLKELTGVEWASQTDGVMHTLGHDCNAAVVYGVLQRLQVERDFEGTLLALFQPGESGQVGGAKSVLASDPFADYDVAAIIGEYIDADLEVGEVGFCPGKFMPAMDELYFNVKGVGAPAAERKNIKDSVVAMSDLILRLNTLNSDMCAVSVGQVAAKGAADVVPDSCSCAGTMWTYDEKLRGRVKEMISHIVEEIEYKHDVEIEAEVRYCSPCVENNTQLTYEAMLIADSHGFVVNDLERRAVADDFGYYSQIYPSLFYAMGARCVPCHPYTATFLPDERSLAVGEELLYQLTLNILNK